MEDIYAKDLPQSYKEIIKNKLFGLLKEREKKGEWEKFLDTILLELMDCGEDKKSIDYYCLFNKLSTCRYLSYKYYRKTIFECMNIIDRIDENELF